MHESVGLVNPSSNQLFEIISYLITKLMWLCMIFLVDLDFP